MLEKLRVLIVEDSENDALLIVNEIKEGGYDPKFERVETKEAFLAALKKGDWDIIISDYSLPKFSGLDAVKLLKESGIDLPFILVSGTIGEEIAVKSFLAGAHDFIVKGKWERFVPAIKRELKEAKVRQERVSAEKQLIKEQKRAQQYLDIAGVLIFVLNRDQKVTLINKKGCEILGYSEDEVIGKNWFDNFIPENIRQEIVGVFNKLMSGEIEPVEYYENLVLTKDGNVRDIAWRNSVLRNDKGEITAIVSSGEDITERKQKEKQIKKQARLLDLIFKYTIDSIVLLDKDYNFIRVSETYAKACKRNSSEFPGHNHFEFYPSKLKDEFDEAVKYKRIYKRDERPFLFSDHPEWGSTYWDLGLVPILNEKGDIELFIFTLKDVTERKKTEEALHDKTRLLQLLQQITVTVNEAATAEKAMQICIDNICSFTKWPVGHVYITDSKGTLIPSKIWYIENKERFKVFRKATEDTSFDRGVGLPGRVLASGKPYWITDVSKVPWFLRTKAGKDIGVKAGFAFPVLEGENVVAVMEFFSNEAVEPDESMLEALSNLAVQVGRVTERRKAEEQLKENENQLRQSQKMEAIGTLAGGIAHDFNNMLTAIMGYTELTMESLNPEDNSYNNLQQALKSSCNARDIVSQLLTFSRKTKEEKEILQLSDLTSETLKLIGSSLPSNVSVEKLIDKNLPQIMGSEVQIQQILMNLCINAGHAMPEGGNLKITLKNHFFDKFKVLPDQEISGLYVVLSTEDSGIGMDKDVIERIFEPFFTTKEVGKGTGLGLSTVFGIVKQHEGYITVDSKKGIGTIFHVYLPAVKKDDETILKTISQEKPTDKKGESILVDNKEKVQNRFEVKISQEEFAISIIGNNPLSKSNEKQLLDYYVLARNDRKRIVVNCGSDVEKHLKNIGFNKFLQIRVKD